MLLPSTVFAFGGAPRDDGRVRVTYGHDAMRGRFEAWERDLERHGLG